MKKIDISAKLIIRITLTVILIILAIFANFISIRRIGRYAIEVDFYDKLSAAYDIGGVDGLKKELAKIKTTDKLRRQLAVIAEFEKKLDSLKDPAAFIENTLSETKRKATLLVKLRTVAIGLISLIFILRIFANARFIRNQKKAGLKKGT